MSLTNNAIATLIKNQTHANDSSFYPTLQVLKVLPVNNSQGTSAERYRVILSDGLHLAQGMFATQHNHRVREKEVIDLSLIRITDYMTNVVQDKSLVIVLGFDIINPHPGRKIGSPVDIGRASADPTPQARNTYGGGGGGGGGVVKSEKPYSSNNPYANPAHSSNPYAQPSAPVVRLNNPTNTPITPIANLNMYQNRWTIKARITSKGDIRHWSNAKGDGSLFSIELLDSSGVDIRATFFKEAVDKFHPLLNLDQVYTLSGGRLKSANATYNNCKSPFEITFDQNSEIHQSEDTGEISQQIYEFIPIAQLDTIDPGQFADVLAVVKSISEPSTIVSKKTGRELLKTELSIADDSGAEVTCTIWGDRATSAQTEFAGCPVVALRRARVSDFGGRTLSAAGGAGGVVVRPRVEGVSKLQGWWDSGGGEGVAKSMSSKGGGAGRFPVFEERKSVGAIKDEGLGQSGDEKPDWVSFKGTFNFMKSDKEGGAWYTACPNGEEPCKNRYKVAQQGDGSFHCERCNQTFQNCVRRFIFSATVADDTSTTWVSVFDDQAKVLFGEGVNADGIYEAMNEQGQDVYDAIFTKANFTDWIFTCKVKQEMNQDEMRVKTSVQSVHPMDYAKEGRSLLNGILAMQ